MKELFSNRSYQIDLSTQKVLYQQFYNVVYRTAYRYCGNETASLDIVHETFIRAFKYISSFKEEKNGSFEGWVVAIAKNESIKYLKSNFLRNEMPTEEISIDKESYENGKNNSLENQVIECMNIEDIYNAMDQIPLHYRQIILLRLIHELSYKEIGNIIGVTENTVRQIYHRAKKEIGILLKEKWGEADEI